MQRAGNTHRAGASDNTQLMRFKSFMQNCAKALNDNNPDSAFYFEQVAEYLSDGGDLTTDMKEISRILGL